MTARWIALGFGFVLLMIVGAFVAAVIFRPERVETAGVTIEDTISGGKRSTGTAGSWAYVVEIEPQADGFIGVIVRVSDSQGRPPAGPFQINAVLGMAAMDMGELAVTLTESNGRWVGSTRLSMTGRWNLRIAFEGEVIVLPFDTESPGR